MRFKLLNLCAAGLFLCLLKAGRIRAGCPVPTIPNAKRTGGKLHPYKLNNFVEYKCEDGYTMKGEAYIVCRENGWSPEPPRCIAPCSSPVLREHVTLTEEFRSHKGFPHGIQVTVECIRGYEPVDMTVSKTITCKETKCTEQLLTCSDVYATPAISNAKRISGKSPPYKLGDFIEYKCEDDYTMKGEAYFRCRANGWDPEPPRCIGPCSSPVLEEHVTLTEEFRSHKTFPHGSNVTVECDCGYEPVDATVSKTITCEETKWTERLLTCKKKDLSEADQGTSCIMQETDALTVKDTSAWAAVLDLVFNNYIFFKKWSS